VTNIRKTQIHYMGRMLSSGTLKQLIHQQPVDLKELEQDNKPTDITSEIKSNAKLYCLHNSC
jgi:hypothetical protein